MVRHFAPMDTSERRTEDTVQHPVLRKVLIDLSIMVVLGVVLAAYNGKSPAEVLDFDIEGYFNELNLLKHQQLLLHPH